MADRFVVTGSGRCGTRYASELLTAAGVPCGHEVAHSHVHRGQWPDGMMADSSWMAATMLDVVTAPVVLLARHPLAVVRSFVEIGFFSHHDAGNPTHQPLRMFAPHVYDHQEPADRALAWWLTANEAALPRAEVLLRLEMLDAGQLGRLLRWAGADPEPASTAFRRTGRTNRHEVMRARTRIKHEPRWRHSGDLALRARRLARLIGYDPDVVPDG